MQPLKKIAISIGDINGISLEIALKAHETIKDICHPIYFVKKESLIEACELLDIDKSIVDEMELVEDNLPTAKIEVGKNSKEAGELAFKSFQNALDFVDEKKAYGILTLPMNKYSLSLAGVNYKGHTDYLRDRYKKDAIMLMGANDLFVALFNDHIRYTDVPKTIDKLEDFLKTLFECTKKEKIGVLALNPHAGDGGVIGDEDIHIKDTLESLNRFYKKNIFDMLVPDIAFIKENREKYDLFVPMYHDQGLIALKTLYFEEAINITLNLPIRRVSVGHGTAFNIAYKQKASLASYIKALQHLLANF